MTSAWTVKVPPYTEPLSLAEAQLHCRVTHSDEDDLFLAWITAARAWVEEYTGRSLWTQTRQGSLSCFPSRRIELFGAAPLQSVTLVQYYDTDNVLQTLSPSVYIVPAFQEPAAIELKDDQSWPSTYLRSDAVQIEYVTGYDDVTQIPPPLLQAVKCMVAHFYLNREGNTTSEWLMAARALCSPYRVWWLAPEC